MLGLVRFTYTFAEVMYYFKVIKFYIKITYTKLFNRTKLTKIIKI